MDLVDSYVKAVAKALPEAQREDIIGELSEDIRSEMEDKQKELGRELTEAEQQALLKQRGNPLLLAARYRQDHRSVAFGRQIIGPVLYPFYVKVLSFNLGLTFLVVAIIFTGLAVSGQRIGFNSIVSTCLLQLFIQLGVVTLIFSVAERHLTKHPDRWHVSGMRGGFQLDLNIERDIQKDILRRVEGGAPLVSRFESLSIIVASAVALAWLTEVQSHPFLILGPAAAFLKLAPISQQLYFPIVLLMVLEIVRAIINLVRPDWTFFRAIFRVILQAGGLLVACFAMKAGGLVTAANGASNYAHAAEIVNKCLFFVFVGGAILSAATLVLRITELVQRKRWQTGPRRVGSAAKEGN